MVQLLAGRSVNLRLELAARARQGKARVVAAALPILQAMIAGSIAYWIGGHVLGHATPFFAPVGAWLALGYTADRHMRRVAELAVGVAIGVGLGDLVVHFIGSGWWQVSLVLGVSAVLARFVDRGPILTVQAGVQAIIIVGLPQMADAGGALGRWTDALTGGLVALVVAALSPNDIRRHPRQLANEALTELSVMLATLGRGLTTGSVPDIEEALVRGRASQPALDEWRDAAGAARDLARVSPAARKHREEITGLGEAALRADRAMRNARVLTRRALSVVDSDEPTALAPIGELVGQIAVASSDLGGTLLAGVGPHRARATLLEVAGKLDPYVLAPADWHAQSLVLLLRSLVVDLLEACGTGPGAARDALAPI